MRLGALLGAENDRPAPACRHLDDYELLDSEDRYRLLIDLGRMLEPMPDALKTDATKVRGCSAAVWVYPTRLPDGRLHFLADSNAAITKGIVALVLTAVQDRPAERSRQGRHRRRARAVRPVAPTELQPHAGHSQHDRARPPDRPAAGRMSKPTPEADAAARTGFDPERFFELASQVGHGRALGMEYRGHGDDWVELSLPWREQLVGVPESGILASGAIVSLIDTSAGIAVWIARGHFRPMVTLDLRIDYLRPAPKGATVYRALPMLQD